MRNPLSRLSSLLLLLLASACGGPDDPEARLGTFDTVFYLACSRGGRGHCSDTDQRRCVTEAAPIVEYHAANHRAVVEYEAEPTGLGAIRDLWFIDEDGGGDVFLYWYGGDVGGCGKTAEGNEFCPGWNHFSVGAEEMISADEVRLQWQPDTEPFSDLRSCR